MVEEGGVHLTRHTTGRCAECGWAYGEDECITCTICGTGPFEVCSHCPPSLTLSG